MYDKEENKNKTPLSVKCTVSYLTDSHSLPRRRRLGPRWQDQLGAPKCYLEKKKKLSGVSGGREVGVFKLLTSIPGDLGRKPPRYFQ